MTLSEWLALLVAVIGLPLTYIWASRGRQTPVLRYATDFDVLVDPADGLLNRGLSLRFRDNEVGRVSRTYIAIWSRRGDTVNREDILDGDPLRVALGAGDIPLQTRVVHKSRDQIGLHSQIVDDQVLLDFVFLDPGDGGIVEVLHQGQERPRLVGTIKGAKIQFVGGRTNLTQSAIGWMANPSRLRRAIGRMRLMRQRFTSRRALVATGVPLVLYVILVVVAVAIAWGPIHPQLVDASKYDLTTLQGQHEFSRKVQDVGFASTNDRLLVAGLVLLQFLAILLILYTGGARRVIPRSIVTQLSTDEESVAQSQPDSLAADNLSDSPRDQASSAED